MAKELSKADYILRSLQKISHKRWELYIVSRIIHKIDDDVEFVCQQLVYRPEGYRALTDIYFPQFNLHLEIDEKHHTNQISEDVERSDDIVLATGHEIHRIKTYGDEGMFKDISIVAEETDNFIDKLNKIKEIGVDNGTFVPWDWDFAYSSRRWINQGYLDVADNPVFRTQAEALRCFGFKGKALQRGAWGIPDGSTDVVWFPRLFRHGMWHNKITKDGERIYECAENLDGKKSIETQLIDAERNPERKTIVFAKAKDSLGRNLLRFVGTFKLNIARSTEDCIVFDRIGTREKVRFL
ncbi:MULTISPECIES: AbaSI family restriction endonuclease [unclassified Halomonas]|uniref:AbaSI family restriction endonuclease n=1 Tax=unclassified Halomonas TaxID=2609666 RepID=UPI002096B169|nr:MULTISPECIES: hypothetical protein [unclassified Halomonas]MCO7216802.1 hypothetical protein [Halomonas sp. OfavH-34-E]